MEDMQIYFKKINKTFRNIANDYTILCSKLQFCVDNDILKYDNLLDLEVSMNDLSINLQSVLYTIAQVEANEISKKELEEELQNKQKTNKLVDSTLVNMMPLFFMCLMIADKDSILHTSPLGKAIIANSKPSSQATPELKQTDIRQFYPPFMELD